MDGLQRSLPRLDGCLSFEADAVRVGDTRVPCHVEQGGVVVVLGDRLCPLTLGERALALSLGAEGLARAVWRLSGGQASLTRSTDEQAVVEAVALYLAGAANTASLRLALIVAGRSVGDLTGAQAVGASIADDLAAGVAAGVADSRTEAGWTVLEVGTTTERDDAEADLRDPVAVRAALVAALLERAELPVSPELADAAAGQPPVIGPAPDPVVAPTVDPAVTPAAAPTVLAGRVHGAPDVELPASVPVPGAGQAAAAAPGEPLPATGPPVTPWPVDPMMAPSRFPAWRTPSRPEPGRAAPGTPRAARAVIGPPVEVPREGGPPAGSRWGPTAAGVRAPAGQVLTGIDWQAVPALGVRPIRTSGPDDGPGRTAAADRVVNAAGIAGAAWAAPRSGRPDDALVDAAVGLSTELAEQLLAAADRRGLA